eukprot:2647132-Ditylum_brightwellii.AAC.1
MHHITTAWTYPDLLQHMKQKFGWTQEAFNSIEHGHLGKIYRKNKKPFQRFITCYLHHCLPVRGTNYASYSTIHCPFCHLTPETSTYFRKHTGNKEPRTDFANSIGYFLDCHNVDPGICILLRMGITGGNLHTTMANHENIPRPEYRNIIHSQSKLGWHHVQYGRFTQDWIHKQMEFEQYHRDTL